MNTCQYKRFVVLTVLCILVGLMTGSLAAADQYPSKNIVWVVSSAPGREKFPT